MNVLTNNLLFKYPSKQFSETNVIINKMLEFVKSANPSIFSKYPYLFLPAVVSVGFYITIHCQMAYTVIFFIYGIITMMDQIAMKDWVNPNLREMKELEQDWGFKAVLYLAVFFELTIYYYAFSILPGLSYYQLIPTAILGIHLFGVGFLLSHELIHKGGFDKILGTINQLKLYYAHWTTEHLVGHHKLVATPGDPASAPKNMTLYQFLPQTLIGTYKSAFKLEPLSTSLCTLAYFGIFSFIWFRIGALQAIVSVIISFGAILILEVINYIQHYGLRRKLLPDGTYEKVTIRHSWNAPHRMSNYLFFKLQRHSDHHENSLKAYQTLCSYDDSPMLPHGYIVCMIMATMPKLWFDVMNPLVDEYNANEFTNGSQLKQLKIAEQKAENFVKKLFMVTGSLALIQWVYLLATKVMMA